MEIYFRKARWLGFIFIVPAIWLWLSMAGYTSQAINGSETIPSYIAVGVCLLVALQCFMGSTRFYFDNGAKAGIQIRKHFYGKRIIRFPYSNILNVTIRCYRRGNKGVLVYRVGITERTTMFGQNATKFTELRSFGSAVEDRLAAQDFAKQICIYTKLNLADDSDAIRTEVGRHYHSNS